MPTNPCNSNNGGCGAESAASCTNDNGVARCTCKANHEKIDGVCKPVNPCDTNNGGCGPVSTTTCMYASPGVGTCSCKTGHRSPTGNGRNCEAWNRCLDESHDCGDNSVCTSTGPGTFSCSCQAGFASDTGKNCQPVDNCLKSPPVCKDNSLCRSTGPGEHTCTCEAGHTSDDGSDCEAIPPCTLQPDRCGTASTCRNTGDYTYECVCLPNYKSPENDGTDCVAINPCVEKPGICGTHSTCRYEDKPGEHTCTCDAGHRSSLPDQSDCEPINPCDAAEPYCGPNTICANTGPDQARCTCKPGYTATGDGPVVSGCVEIDECAAVDCRNGATCVDKLSDYECQCAGGFTGRHCEINIDDCAGSPCQHDGTCVDGVESYTCLCREGYTGERCETNIDDCAGSPCANDGTCQDGVASFACVCASGWTGATCMQDIDECASSPCGENTRCVNTEGGYACECLPGYSADDAQEGAQAGCSDVDECADGLDDCHGNAACANTEGGYTCACKDGYTGDGKAACDDVDECEQGLDDCDDNAACENVPGTFACECRAGYAGDGTQCHRCEVTCASGQYLAGACEDDLPPPRCVGCTPCDRGLTSVGGCAGDKDTICADVEPPTITFIGDNPLVIEAGDDYTPATVSAVDTYDGAVTVKIAGEDAISTASPGAFRVLYTATDKAGNSVSYERKVSVVDTTPPRLTLIGKATMVLEAGAAFVEPGYAAFDTVDGDATDRVLVTAVPQLPIDTRVVGSTTLTYAVRDEAGNSNTVKRVVVVQDTTGPDLQLRGDLQLRVEGTSAAGAQWVDPGVVSAEDVVDGDLAAQVSVVTARTTAAARGAPPACPDGFARLNPELGYVAPDFATDEVDLAAPAGTVYTLTYRVTDAAGNPTVATRTVEIIDTRPPTLVVSPGLELSFDVPQQDALPAQPNSTVASTGLPVVTSFEELTIVARDALDGDMAGLLCTALLRDGMPPSAQDNDDGAGDDGSGPARRRRRRDVLGGLDPSAPVGTAYEIALYLKDFSGRILQQSISMTVADTRPPYILLNGGLEYSVEFGPPFREPGFTATDGRDGNLTGQVVVTGTVEARYYRTGSQSLTYTVADSAGNVANVTRIVTLEQGTLKFGSTGSDSSAGPVGMIVGIVVGVLLILLLLFGVVRRRRRRHDQQKALQAQALAYHGPDNGLGSFTNPAYGWDTAEEVDMDQPEGQMAAHGLYQPVDGAGGAEAETGYLEIDEAQAPQMSRVSAAGHGAQYDLASKAAAAHAEYDTATQGRHYDSASPNSRGRATAYDLATTSGAAAPGYDQPHAGPGEGNYLRPGMSDAGYASIGQGTGYDRAGSCDPAYSAADAGFGFGNSAYDLAADVPAAAGDAAYDVAHGGRGDAIYDTATALPSAAAYDEPSAMLQQTRPSQYEQSAASRLDATYDRATGEVASSPHYATAREAGVETVYDSGTASASPYDNSTDREPAYATAQPFAAGKGMPPAASGDQSEEGTYDNVGQLDPEADYARTATGVATYDTARPSNGAPAYDQGRSVSRGDPAYDVVGGSAESPYDLGAAATGERPYDLGSMPEATYDRAVKAGASDAKKEPTYDVASDSGC